MCPLINGRGLFAFIVPSPKQHDLHRDGRYALHSVPLERSEDAFYVTGHARHVTNADLRASLAGQFADERAALSMDKPDEEQDLFELDVSMAMLTRTTGHGDPTPQHAIWHA